MSYSLKPEPVSNQGTVGKIVSMTIIDGESSVSKHRSFTLVIPRAEVSPFNRCDVRLAGYGAVGCGYVGGWEGTYF